MGPLPPTVLGGDPWIGRIIDGKYRVLARLGAGGMGMVYRARHTILETDVAMKFINPVYAGDPEFQKRFLREAQTSTMFVHKNAVPVRDLGAVDGVLYLTMDFAEGETMADLLKREGALPQSRACTIIEQVLEALVEAHRAAILHRDLKPANVMIGAGDFVRILDFGIAKWMNEAAAARGPHLTATGATLGTLLYMSPEQAEGKPLDARSDLYSVSVMLYEMLAGRVPIFAETSAQMLMKIASEWPVPLLKAAPGPCDRKLGVFVMKGLEKEAGKRPPTAAGYLGFIRRIRREAGF